MKPFLLTFDVEEFDWPLELGRPLSPADQMRVTDEGLEQILPLLAARAVRATFFVTGEFAKARPHSVRAIVQAGHEAAVHGLSHHDDYRLMAPATAVERLRVAREIVEAISGAAATGVRTPRLRLCAAAVLRAAGFTYDATPHPTWVPGRYNGLRLPRSPWMDEGIMRVPISVLPGLRVPVSWIWYRLAGPVLGKLAAGLALSGAPYLHVYFHPWEAIDIRRCGIPALLAARTGAPFVTGLDGMIAWAALRLMPMPVGELVRRMSARSE